MRSNRWLWGPALVLLALLGAGLFAAREPLAYAHIAAGYAAKDLCSCLHVTQRSLEACQADLPDGAGEALQVTITGDQVRATLGFGAVSATAQHFRGQGCTLVR